MAPCRRASRSSSPHRPSCWPRIRVTGGTAAGSRRARPARSSTPACRWPRETAATGRCAPTTAPADRRPGAPSRVGGWDSRRAIGGRSGSAIPPRRRRCSRRTTAIIASSPTGRTMPSGSRSTSAPSRPSTRSSCTRRGRSTGKRTYRASCSRSASASRRPTTPGSPTRPRSSTARPKISRTRARRPRPTPSRRSRHATCG